MFLKEETVKAGFNKEACHSFFEKVLRQSKR